ncbi:hypothetical protein ACGRPS_04070 [Vibrio furnissii]|uniref:hypothetical protein n=1 Tax=Vibrio furnissii TaxID=29494 RepID=UPI0024BB1629|nr:hypothetical protein [Vibrio furnissii]MCE7627916.1 hypothetical protein [Vibrio fluvialis]WHR51317.1 hypothetical protein O8413_15195 [Vibrio furnissii]
MKYKLITACITAAVLAGCGSDDSSDSVNIQAYDGAIMGIAGNFSCDNNVSGSIGTTNYQGMGTANASIFSYALETCTFNFIPTVGAVDVSNGKEMDAVSLSIPKGLFTSGTPIATPFTTLVAKALPEGASYDSSTASDVLSKVLGSSFLNNTGLSVSQLMTNLDQSLSSLSDTNKSQLLATTHVLTDVMANASASSLTTDQIATATQNIAAKVVNDNPSYGDGTKFVTVPSTVDLDAVKDAVIDDVTTIPDVGVVEKDSQPVEDPDNATGSTGGTGGTGSVGGGTGGA